MAKHGESAIDVVRTPTKMRAPIQVVVCIFMAL